MQSWAVLRGRTATYDGTVFLTSSSCLHELSYPIIRGQYLYACIPGLYGNLFFYAWFSCRSNSSTNLYLVYMWTSGCLLNQQNTFLFAINKHVSCLFYAPRLAGISKTGILVNTGSLWRLAYSLEKKS